MAPTLSRTVTQLCTDALLKIRAARAGDVQSPDDLAFALQVLNELLDVWNTDDRAAYTVNFSDFTFVPNVSPTTIGPSGSAAGATDPNFVVSQRPREIQYAAVNLGGNVFTPITVRDDAWYQRQTTPAITQTFPTDLYYSPDWHDPNGTGLAYGDLYFWGVPTVAYVCRLWMRILLSQVALTDQFSLPPAYYHALKLTLAEWIAEDFGQPVTPTLMMQAREARETVFGGNVQVPRLQTQDSGMPGRGRLGGGDFNYGSRSFNT